MQSHHNEGPLLSNNVFKRFFEHFGRIVLMLTGIIRKPENKRVYWKEFMEQCEDIGIRTLPIVLIISFFMGAVFSVQTAYKLTSPLIPKYIIASIVRDGAILELSPTVLCVVLAGVIGSKITAQLGNLRMSEQIDALEIMGINTRTFLVLPRIVAAVLLIPCLIVISIFISIIGGYVSCVLTHIVTPQQYYQGLIYEFIPYDVFFAMVKAFFYALIITIIPCYYGYYAEGGALAIGRATTKAVITCCILIVIVDYLLSVLLL